MSQSQSIVILHGWGVESSRYEDLKQLLESDFFKVYIPDFPMDKTYTIFDYKDFLINYINKNNIIKPILLGHSFGGRVALVAASSKPYKFSLLILTGVPGYNPVPSLKVHLFYLLAKIGKIFFLLPPLSLFDKLARKFLYFLSGSFDYYKAQGPLKQTFQNIIKTDLDPYIKNIKIPTLLIWGGKDTITPVWIAEKMKNNIKNSKLEIIKNKKHNLPFLNPELFVKTIESYV